MYFRLGGSRCLHAFGDASSPVKIAIAPDHMDSGVILGKHFRSAIRTAIIDHADKEVLRQAKRSKVIEALSGCFTSVVDGNDRPDFAI
jgi:hypothetical protein